jgi:Protein of unknown function (DUF2905)
MSPGGTSELGRLLILAGALLVVAGLVLTLAGKVPYLGRLPGDIVYRKGGLTLYLPITTSILLSLLLTLLLMLFRRG